MKVLVFDTEQVLGYHDRGNCAQITENQHQRKGVKVMGYMSRLPTSNAAEVEKIPGEETN